MDFNVIAGVIRAIAPAAIAYAVGAGFLPAGDYAGVVAAVIALGSAVWSVKSNVVKK